jgi:ketosteroid isomerase-like protein
MSQENVELVRREYVALSARDWEAVADVWHEDIELQTGDCAPGAPIYRGIGEITRYFDTWSEPFSEYRVDADEIRDLGEQVVVLERYAGRGLKGAELGEWLESTLARLITFRDGKIWRVKEYLTIEQALEAAGLRE